MKTDVEELSPTRVRLSVEVPFEELKPSLDQAYREVGRQVRIPGFRPGHVPRQVLDQRVGRSAVLEQAINDALPGLYSDAVREAKVTALGQPELEVTRLDDGTELAFTAEVDIRPAFELPDFSTLQVAVDDADVSPDQVEEYLGSLRERFASLRAANRPARAGAYVSLDLRASVGGEPVEDAQATGISYEVGGGTILDGLDDTLIGMSAEETATFQSELTGGKHEGSQAEVTVTVRSVKVKDLPELDDDFAQSASEFNTVGELRANTRKQLEQMSKSGQISQARDRAIEALLDRIDIPLPEAIVEHEIGHRHESLSGDLNQAGLTLADYLENRGIKPADLDKEIADGVRRSLKAQFILDQIAETEELSVEEAELGEYLTQLAYSSGMSPDALVRQLSSQNQVGAVVADVLRSKAASLLAERVRVTDASGREITIAEPAGTAAGGEAEAGAGEPAPAKARGGRKRSTKAPAE